MERLNERRGFLGAMAAAVAALLGFGRKANGGEFTWKFLPGTGKAIAKAVVIDVSTDEEWVRQWAAEREMAVMTTRHEPPDGILLPLNEMIIVAKGIRPVEEATISISVLYFDDSPDPCRSLRVLLSDGAQPRRSISLDEWKRGPRHVKPDTT